MVLRIVSVLLVLGMMIASWGLASDSGTASSFGWQTPTLLQSYTDYEQAESVGMDDQGNALVLWEQPMSNTTTEAIWSNRYDASSGWGIAERVWDGPFFTGYTTMGVSANGAAVATWYAEAPPNNTGLYVRLFDPASGWGSFTVLASNNDNQFGHLAAAMDRNGNALIVGALNTGSALGGWYYDTSSGWDSGQAISVSGSYPHVQFDGLGNAMAVWDDYPADRVMSSRFLQGSGWGPATVVSGSIGGYWSNAAVNATGYAMATFFLHNGTAWQMYGNLYDPATGWGVPVSIGPVNGGWHPFGGSVVAGANGEFIVAWEQTNEYAAVNREAWSRNWTESSGWGTPTKLNPGTATPGPGMYVRIAANAKGEAVATWTEGNSTIQHVAAARYTPASGWGAPEVIDTSATFSAWLGSVAMAPSGNAVAVWRQSNGVDDLLWGNVYLVRAGPPLNLSQPTDGEILDVPTAAVRGTTMPNASLVVNGMAVAVEDDGSFQVNVALITGANEIWARATDEFGDATEVSVTVTYTDPVPGLILQIASLQNQLNVTMAELNQSNDDLADALAEIVSLSSELSTVSALLNQTIADLDQTNAELAAAQSEVVSLTADLATLTNLLSSLANNLSNTKSDLWNLENDTADLQDQLSDSRGDLNATQDDLDTSEGKISSLQSVQTILIVLVVVLAIALGVALVVAARRRGGAGDKSSG